MDTLFAALLQEGWHNHHNSKRGRWLVGGNTWRQNWMVPLQLCKGV